MGRLEQRELSLEKIKDELATTETKLAASELTIGGQYFQIFGLLIGFSGVVVGVALYVIQKYASARIKSAQASLEAHIASRIKHASILTIGETYALLALPWWENYEAEYVRFLNKEITDASAFYRDILIARRLTDKGLEAMKSITSEKGMSVEFVITYAKLYNHWVYHKAAEILCGTQPPSPLTVSELLAGAEECVRLAKKKDVGRLWFNLQQTAAFTFLMLGDQRTQQEGRKLMSGLFHGKAPGLGFERPPTAWLCEIWDECYPIRHGTRVDVFALGNVQRPA